LQSMELLSRKSSTTSGEQRRMFPNCSHAPPSNGV
jgi:hypothetical protein